MAPPKAELADRFSRLVDLPTSLIGSLLIAFLVLLHILNPPIIEAFRLKVFDELQTLHPRLKSEPNVLFARAPNLAPGKYVMHWSVPAANGSTVYQGDVSFSVEKGRP